MGLLSLVSLIPFMRGDSLTGFGFLAVDFLTDTMNHRQEQEQRMLRQQQRDNSVNGNHEIMQLFGWACGEHFLQATIDLKIVPASDKFWFCVISMWNEIHGNIRELCHKNPPKYNMAQIVKFWCALGKP